MLQSKIALIDETKRIGHVHLSQVAAAIQTQLNNHVAPVWGLSPTVVTTMEAGATVPPDVWPIFVVDVLPPGEGGYHTNTRTGQPYAVVKNGRGWTVALSHEAIEMSVDPAGMRLQSGRNIELNGPAQTLGKNKVAYLIEVCDPPESHGYVIDGVAVSDFVTPAYYQDASGARYDYMGRIKTPLQILFGGYISWIDPVTDDMMQITWLDPSAPPQLTNLGSAQGKRSLKEHVDGLTQAIEKIASSDDHPAVKLAEEMAAN